MMADGVLARDVMPPPVSIRRPGKRAGLAAAGLGMLAGAAWYSEDWWTRGRFIETTNDAYVGGDVTSISPHVPGFVAAVKVGDNEPVKRGPVLIRLDPKDFVAALDGGAAVGVLRPGLSITLQVDTRDSAP